MKLTIPYAIDKVLLAPGEGVTVETDDGDRVLIHAYAEETIVRAEHGSETRVLSLLDGEIRDMDSEA